MRHPLAGRDLSDARLGALPFITGWRRNPKEKLKMKPSDTPLVPENKQSADLTSIQHLILHGLRRLNQFDQPSVIDLLATPFGPGEREALIETLGVGEVDARIETEGTSRVYETTYRGVWVVDHGTADGERLAYQIEITQVPDILLTQPEDLEESASRLAERLGDGIGVEAGESGEAISFNMPVLGFAAYSGAGKTTLLKRLIPMLREQGLRIGLVKHAHHDFDLDIPGKDSYELRKAGASQVVVASSLRWALVHENEEPSEPKLADALRRFDPDEFDLILVEGFKHVRFAKIELYRPSMGVTPIHPQDPSVIAVATDGEPPEEIALPVLDLNDLRGIQGFLMEWLEG